MYRLYNGELKDSAPEAIDTIISISKVLENNQSYVNMKSCLDSFVQSIKSCAAFTGTIDPVDITLNDVTKIISSTAETAAGSFSASVLCLSDLHRLLGMAIKVLTDIKSKSKEQKEKKRKYMQMKRKVYFLTAWCKENQNNISDLEEHVCRRREVMMVYWKAAKEHEKMMDNRIKKLRFKKKTRLIQEI